MEFADLYLFLVSMLIGALVGAERQRRMVEADIEGLAGLRTFILISLLGTLSAHMAGHFGQIFLIIAFASFTLLVAAAFAASSGLLGKLDFTSAVAAEVTYILGALCYQEQELLLAVALAILITTVLATRKISHRYVEAISETELLDTLKMGIIALVVLPLLPDETVGPFEVFNPRQIWLMVVLVSLISYVGYVLIKVLGVTRGLGLTGVLGGLVSSTAVTTTMASEAKINHQLLHSAVFASVVASCMMFPRVLFVILVVNKDLFLPLLLPLAGMALTGFSLAYLLTRREVKIETKVEHKDLFTLLPALQFGAFFAFILLTSKLASTYFGETGTYAAGVIGGLPDVDAITLSMATLAKTTITQNIAVTSIALATITNTLVKLSIAFVMGTREFGTHIARIFLPMIAVGLLAIFAVKIQLGFFL